MRDWAGFEDLAEEIRRDFAAGRCPCCGDSWATLADDDPPAVAIAEGVLICGTCIERGHVVGEFREFFLDALIGRV